MSEPQFIHAERALVEGLGVPQKKLRVFRQDELERGADWASAHGEVRYSESGRVKIMAWLQIPPEQPEKKIAPEAPAPEPTPAAGGQPVTMPKSGDREELTCGKCYRPNVRIVEATRANQDRVLVRVKDNRNLRPGMMMKCRFGAGTIWELDQRLPRWPGKW